MIQKDTIPPNANIQRKINKSTFCISANDLFVTILFYIQKFAIFNMKLSHIATLTT